MEQHELRQVWLAAYCAAIQGAATFVYDQTTMSAIGDKGCSYIEAANIADKAVADYEKRWTHR